MKSIQLLLVFLFLAPVHLFSQEKSRIHYGIKGGLNNTHIRGVEATGAKTGYIGTEVYGSFFLEAGAHKNTYFGTELLFSYTESYHFFEIPLHIKQVLTRRLVGFAGPKFDLYADKLVENDPYARVRTCGISAEGGLQYRFFRNIFAELRYSIGISKQINDFIFDINDGRRNTLRVGIGIRFK